jgi:hypothetical protein
VLSRIAIAAVVLSFLVAARLQAQDGADPRDLGRLDFTLEGVHYRILLPRRATRMVGSDRLSVSMSSRLMRQLHLRPARRGSDGKYAHVEKLSNGAVLSYNIDRDVSGSSAGSGGTEGRLEGVLWIGTRTLAVTCSDQDELFAP